MKTYILIGAAVLWTTAANAQTIPSVDWCAMPLSYQSTPEQTMIFRLRCTVQKLDQERAAAADATVAAQIDGAVYAAHLSDVNRQLATVRKQRTDLANYWKNWCGKKLGCLVRAKVATVPPATVFRGTARR